LRLLSLKTCTRLLGKLSIVIPSVRLRNSSCTRSYGCAEFGQARYLHHQCSPWLLAKMRLFRAQQYSWFVCCFPRVLCFYARLCFTLSKHTLVATSDCLRRQKRCLLQSISIRNEFSGRSVKNSPRMVCVLLVYSIVQASLACVFSTDSSIQTSLTLQTASRQPYIFGVSIASVSALPFSKDTFLATPDCLRR